MPVSVSRLVCTILTTLGLMTLATMALPVADAPVPTQIVIGFALGVIATAISRVAIP